jgi:TPR repeat protein
LKSSPIQIKADQGDASAQFQLGVEFANHDGAMHDYVSALKWYLKAGEQNHAQAQLFLGIMYARGQGLPRNSLQAVHWFNRAAHQGYAAAQYHLGVEFHRLSLDETASTAKESRIEAYKWLQLAVAQHYPDSQSASERVIIRMNHDDVVEGNKRVAAFLSPTSPGATKIFAETEKNS